LIWAPGAVPMIQEVKKAGLMMLVLFPVKPAPAVTSRSTFGVKLTATSHCLA
jgi:hypothetical protein